MFFGTNGLKCPPKNSNSTSKHSVHVGYIYWYTWTENRKEIFSDLNESRTLTTVALRPRFHWTDWPLHHGSRKNYQLGLITIYPKAKIGTPWFHIMFVGTYLCNDCNVICITNYWYFIVIIIFKNTKRRLLDFIIIFQPYQNCSGFGLFHNTKISLYQGLPQ